MQRGNGGAKEKQVDTLGQQVAEERLGCQVRIGDPEGRDNGQPFQLDVNEHIRIDTFTTRCRFDEDTTFDGQGKKKAWNAKIGVKTSKAGGHVSTKGDRHDSELSDHASVVLNVYEEAGCALKVPVSALPLRDGQTLASMHYIRSGKLTRHFRIKVSGAVTLAHHGRNFSLDAALNALDDMVDLQGGYSSGKLKEHLRNKVHVEIEAVGWALKNPIGGSFPSTTMEQASTADAAGGGGGGAAADAGEAEQPSSSDQTSKDLIKGAGNEKLSDQIKRWMRDFEAQASREKPAFTYGPEDISFYSHSVNARHLDEDVRNLVAQLNLSPTPLKNMQAELELHQERLQRELERSIAAEGGDGADLALINASVAEKASELVDIVHGLQSLGIVFFSEDGGEEYPFRLRYPDGKYVALSQDGRIGHSVETIESATHFVVERVDDAQEQVFYLKESSAEGRYLTIKINGYDARFCFEMGKKDDTAKCTFSDSKHGTNLLMIGTLTLSNDGHLVGPHHRDHLQFVPEDSRLFSSYPVEQGELQFRRDTLSLKIASANPVEQIPASANDHNFLLGQFIMGSAPKLLTSKREGEHLAIVLGPAGAGKSTIINKGLGREFSYGPNGKLMVTNPSLPHASMSSEPGKGHTEFPELYRVERGPGKKDVLLCDTPGLFDFESSNKIIHTLTMRLALALAEVGSIVVVISDADAESNRGRTFLELVKTLVKIIPNNLWELPEVSRNIHFVVNGGRVRKQWTATSFRDEFVAQLLEDFGKKAEAERAAGIEDGEYQACCQLLDIINAPGSNLYCWQGPSEKNGDLELLLDRLSEVDAAIPDKRPIGSARINFDCYAASSEEISRLLGRFAREKEAELSDLLAASRLYGELCSSYFRDPLMSVVQSFIVALRGMNAKAESMINGEEGQKATKGLKACMDPQDLVDFQTICTEFVHSGGKHNKKRSKCASLDQSSYLASGCPPFERIVPVQSGKGMIKGFPTDVKVVTPEDGVRHFYLEQDKKTETFSVEVDPNRRAFSGRYKQKIGLFKSIYPHFPAVEVAIMQGRALYDPGSKTVIDNLCRPMLEACRTVLSHLDTDVHGWDGWLKPLRSEKALPEESPQEAQERSTLFEKLYQDVIKCQELLLQLSSRHWDVDSASFNEETFFAERLATCQDIVSKYQTWTHTADQAATCLERLLADKPELMEQTLGHWRVSHPGFSERVMDRQLIRRYRQLQGDVQNRLDQKEPFMLGVVYQVMELFQTVFAKELEEGRSTAVRTQDVDSLSSFFKTCALAYERVRNGQLQHKRNDLLNDYTRELRFPWTSPQWQSRLLSFSRGAVGFCYAAVGQIMHSNRLRLVFRDRFRRVVEGNIASTVRWLANELGLFGENAEQLNGHGLYEIFSNTFEGVGLAIVDDTEQFRGFMSGKSVASLDHCSAVVRVAVGGNGMYHSVHGHPVSGCLAYTFPSSVPFSLAAYPEYYTFFNRFRSYPNEIGKQFRVRNRGGVEGYLTVYLRDIQGVSAFQQKDLYGSWKNYLQDFFEKWSESHGELMAVRVGHHDGESGDCLHISGGLMQRFQLFARFWSQSSVIEQSEGAMAANAVQIHPILAEAGADDMGGGGGGAPAAGPQVEDVNIEGCRAAFDCKIM